MCVRFKREGTISTQSGEPLKLVDKFMYLGSSVSSTESDANIRLAKVWTAIDRLLIKRKSDLPNKITLDFFRAVAVSILLYGCTTWTLKKHMEKKLDGNYTRMLRISLNKSWKQHPHETTAVRLLASHLTNHPSKTNKTCRKLLEKQGRTHKRRFLIGPYT